MCRSTAKLHSWWVPIKHDIELLKAIDKYEFGNWDEVVKDPEFSLFKVNSSKQTNTGLILIVLIDVNILRFISRFLNFQTHSSSKDQEIRPPKKYSLDLLKIGSSTQPTKPNIPQPSSGADRGPTLPLTTILGVTVCHSSPL